MTTFESPFVDSPRPLLVDSFWERDRSVDLIDITVGGLLAERATTHAAAPALVGNRHGSGEQLRLTYAELYSEAQHVATALRSLVAEGDFVALWAPNVVEWPIIQYGAALAGVVLVALNPVLRERELRYALGHSGARVLIHADRSRDYYMAAVADKLGFDRPEVQIVSLTDRTTWRSESVSAEVAAGVDVDPDSAAMLQYTSGTTGNPKGVLLRHRSLVNVARASMQFAGIERGAVMVNPLPMFHTAACVVATLGPLWLGATEILIEQFVPAPVLEAMRDENATMLFFVPAVLNALLECQRASSEPAPRVRTIFGGAANVPASMIEAAERVFGASIMNVFGQTELAPVLSGTRRTDARVDQLNTVGRPIPQVDCKIVDPSTGIITPVGVVGEICARGHQQMIGYYKDPEATARAVDKDGFVRTGDLGSMDERGYLTVSGRLKDLIIRGGENISPMEIETCLAAHEKVLDAAVVGLPDDRTGESVAVVVRLRGEEPGDLRAQLEKHARELLSPHKIPSRWFVTDEFPVTPTGKVRKFKVVDAVVVGSIRELP